MATPKRMVELECPVCQRPHWEIDCDYRGAEIAYLLGLSTTPRELPYDEREYRCPACNEGVVGYRVLQKSPPEFFIQPNPVRPMASEDFAYWLSVFRTHFPTDDLLKTVGVFWYPGSSEAQYRNLCGACNLGVVRGYQLGVCNRSPDDEFVRVRVTRGLSSVAEFRCGSTIDRVMSSGFGGGELEDIRELLATKATDIRRSWQRFVKLARKAQAVWMPKLGRPVGG